MVGMPVRYHHALYGRKRRSKAGKVAREGLGFGTCVKEREVGVRPGGVMCFLGYSYCKLSIGLVSTRAQSKLRSHERLRDRQPTLFQ